MLTRSILSKAFCSGTAVALTSIVMGSCSANSGDNNFGDDNGTGGSGAGSGTGGDSGTLFDAGNSDGTMDEDGACIGESFPGKLAPLDVYVLLDATGSMMDTKEGPAVWPAVTAALIDVVSDPMTEGIGMGLTYLPNPPPPGTQIPGVCGPSIACSVGTCDFVGIAFVCSNGCASDADCGLYGPCMPFLKGPICNGAIAPSVSCDPTDYGQPVVAIDTLPGNKAALVQAISTKDPNGEATPTQPSLEGTLMYAHQWALDHPTHLVNVLFATDGSPNDCTYNSINGAAAAAETAFQDAPSVPTFVLGIGNLSSLDTIAQKGGTGQAYIANSGNVASKLVDVFNEIRANGACQFQIPQPKDGQTLDYDRVNVYYTPLGSDTKVPVKNVKDASACDPVEGGWYYDDPTKTHPTKILLCPATCSGVQLSEEGVEVLLGCKTILK